MFDRPTSHLQAALAELVVELDADPERVGRLRMDHARERGALSVAILQLEGQPAHKPVNGVFQLRLVERCTTELVPEAISAVLEPVRPRSEHLASCAGVDLVDRELPEHRLGPKSETAQRGPDLGYDGAQLAASQIDLLARWREHGR